LTALAATGWLLLHAGLAVLERGRERECHRRLEAVRTGLLAFKNTHLGRLPSDYRELQRWSTLNRIPLTCPSAAAGPAAIYIVPAMAGPLGTTDPGVSSGGEANVAAVCATHLHEPASSDQPMLVKTWDGTLYRIPRSKLGTLRPGPQMDLAALSPYRHETE
jgi:hypothetical protein